MVPIGGGASACMMAVRMEPPGAPPDSAHAVESVGSQRLGPRGNVGLADAVPGSATGEGSSVRDTGRRVGAHARRLEHDCHRVVLEEHLEWEGRVTTWREARRDARLQRERVA